MVHSPTTFEGPNASQQFRAMNDGVDESTLKVIDPTADGMEMEILGDNSSEATLVSTPSIEDSIMVDAAVKDQQQQILEDKENLAPTKSEGDSARPPSPEKQPRPLSEASLSRLNAQAGADLAATGASPLNLGQNEKPLNVTEQPSRPPPVPPRPLPQTATPMLEEYARQQDVTEVISHSLFQLSCAIKPTGIDKNGEQLDQIQDLFYGKTKSHVIPEDPSHSIEEKFSSIIARLSSKPHDVYAALDGTFDVEEMEGGSRRYLSISKVPPIFQVHFDRVGYDKTTQTYRKVNHHVDLKETIYLDRYLEADVESSLMDRRRQTWAWKKELAKVDARRQELNATTSHPAAVPTFEAARNIMVSLQASVMGEDVDDLNVPSSAIDTLETLVEETRAELDSLDAKARDLFQKADTNFTDSDMRCHEYRLHAAFFHRGTQGSGHYWVYIYDFKREIWRKYNDGYVSEVKDTKEIFRAPTQEEQNTWNGPPNPYFLVYVRDDIKDRLVESVYRKIVAATPPPTPPEQDMTTIGADAQMTDLPRGGEGQSENSGSVAPSPSVQPQPVATSGARVTWDSSEANIQTQW